jgi:rsbT co-antagonist protein RsbR
MSTIFERLFRLSAGLLATASKEGYFLELNPAWTTTLGWTLEELKSKPFLEFVHPDDRDATGLKLVEQFDGLVVQKFENRYRCLDGAYKWLSWNAYVDMSEEPSTRVVYASAHDVTAHKHAVKHLETALTQLRETMQAMSTPLIPITDKIVVVPLIGHIDPDRARQVMLAALEGVKAHQVQVLILDVTGLHDMDAQVAAALVDTAKALRLLGAQTVMTGIRPAAAQTLAGLDLDLAGLHTQGTLQSAVASAIGRAGALPLASDKAASGAR